MQPPPLQRDRKIRQAASRGFALPSVMVAIMILSLLAGSLIQLRSSLSYSQKDGDQRVKLDMAMRSAMNIAFLGLTDTRGDKRWRVDGVPTTIESDGVSVTLTIQDESGKVDLNAAPRDVFVRLFQSAGSSPDAAATMADRILDWREANNLAHLNGSTDADYRASGSKFHPRHGPFQSVAELKMVLGMTPELFDQLQPALTVYSQSQQINRQTAPREALLTLPDVNESSADTIINDRVQGAEDQVDRSLFARPGVMNPLLPLAGRSFTITAAVKNGSNPITHEEVIRITDDPKRPFFVLMWK